MRPHLVAATLALTLVACAAPRPTSPPSATPVPAPTATPINVDDMMGFYPQQTVFVAANDHVAAVTLLNHFTRYRIPTDGVAQVAADGAARWLFVLDADGSGSHRLRAFGVPEGAEIARQDGIDHVAAENRGALSAGTPGRVLVLKSDAGRARVDAYDAPTLRPLGTVAEAPGCGDRLVASAARVAIVCRATGKVVLDDLRGSHTAIEGAPPNLVAAAMAADGALYVATADRRLAAVPAGGTKLVEVPWPSEWWGTVLPDGLALADSGRLGLVAQQETSGAWLRIFTTEDVAHRWSLHLDGTPQGGILALAPFAYYAVGSTVRHVDLNSGALETMTDAGVGAVPGAVVNG